MTIATVYSCETVETGLETVRQCVMVRDQTKLSSKPHPLFEPYLITSNLFRCKTILYNFFLFNGSDVHLCFSS